MEPRHPQDEATTGQDLLLYSGILVSFRIPRQCETALLDAAMASIKRDIETSIERHLPPGCAADLQKMA